MKISQHHFQMFWMIGIDKNFYEIKIEFRNKYPVFVTIVNRINLYREI